MRLTADKPTAGSRLERLAWMNFKLNNIPISHKLLLAFVTICMLCALSGGLSLFELHEQASYFLSNQQELHFSGIHLVPAGEYQDRVAWIVMVWLLVEDVTPPYSLASDASGVFPFETALVVPFAPVGAPVWVVAVPF